MNVKFIRTSRTLFSRALFKNGFVGSQPVNIIPQKNTLYKVASIPSSLFLYYCLRDTDPRLANVDIVLKLLV